MVKILNSCAVAAALLLAACGPSGTSTSRDVAPAPVSTDTRVAKHLFGAIAGASSERPRVYGGYSKGCLAGGVALAETGPTWQAMRLSRNRNWGHPVLIDYIQELSAKVAKLPGWEGLYVGDMSQPRGGPMRTGHVSHQNGIDVDMWMLPPKRLNLTRTERENLSSISTRRSAGAYTNSNWTPEHRQVLKLAASDPRVERIFVFPGAKVDMCKNETGDRSYLRKIRPWWGHHYHFHVRLACPPGSPDCQPQVAVPAGDGCADAERWVSDILNPPPPDPNAPPPKPRRELRVNDLPLACEALLTSN